MSRLFLVTDVQDMKAQQFDPAMIVIMRLSMMHVYICPHSVVEAGLKVVTRIPLVEFKSEI